MNLLVVHASSSRDSQVSNTIRITNTTHRMGFCFKRKQPGVFGTGGVVTVQKVNIIVCERGWDSQTRE